MYSTTKLEDLKLPPPWARRQRSDYTGGGTKELSTICIYTYMSVCVYSNGLESEEGEGWKRLVKARFKHTYIYIYRLEGVRLMQVGRVDVRRR